MDLNDLRTIRKRLMAELARVDALISEFDALAAKYAPELLQENLAPRSPTVTRAAPSAVRRKSSKAKGRASPMGDVTADAVAAVMEESGRPLTLAEVVQAAVAAGVPVPAKKKSLGDVVGSRIRRSKRFHSIPGKGWWFKDRPLPGERDASPGNETPDLPLVNGSGASAFSSQKGGDGHAATLAH